MPSLGRFSYIGIFFAAAIEGEVVYVSAVVLAVLGRLNPAGVLVAGAFGGSFGDQFYFYVLRSRLAHILNRFPSIARRRDLIRHRVQDNVNLLVLSSRFLPGLRVAIPAACAYAGVAPLRFSALNTISAFGWAGAIMALVMYLGPGSLKELGLRAWWAPLIPAVLVVLFFRWLSRKSNSEER